MPTTPSRRFPRAFALTAAAWAAALAPAACATAPAVRSAGHAAVGRQPAFELPDLEGRPVRVSEFRGRPVIVDFWASWCAPCGPAMAFYDRMAREHGGRLVVLGVNLDEDEEAARAALRDRPVSFPVLRDPEGRTAESLSLSTMPSSYFLDADGKVVRVHEGFVPGDEPELSAAVRELVGSASARGTRAGAAAPAAGGT